MLDFVAFGLITVWGIRSYFSTNMPPFSYDGTSTEFDQKCFKRGQAMRHNSLAAFCCGNLLDWSATAVAAFTEHNDGFALLMARSVAAGNFDETFTWKSTGNPAEHAEEKPDTAGSQIVRQHTQVQFAMAAAKVQE